MISSECIWMLMVSRKLDGSFEKLSDEKKNNKIRDQVKKTLIFLALANENEYNTLQIFYYCPLGNFLLKKVKMSEGNDITIPKAK